MNAAVRQSAHKARQVTSGQGVIVASGLVEPTLWKSCKDLRSNITDITKLTGLFGAALNAVIAISSLAQI
jgi:hypothetical protein